MKFCSKIGASSTDEAITKGLLLMKTLYICPMQNNPESALKVAEFLLQIKAVVLKPQEPFTWASGWKSPIYCDNRKTLSYPLIRTYIRQEMVKMINMNFGKPDVIVGVATAGIPQGVLIAQDLGVPFAYVRSSEKKHGLGNKIEGVVEPGNTAIVIEDLISTGGSSLDAVSALREAGITVKGMAAIFTYGFDISVSNFKEAKCQLVTLSDYDTLIQKALQSNYVSKKDLESLKAWRKDPSNWNK